MFGTMQTTLGLLKTLTNFNLLEFDQLVVKGSHHLNPCEIHYLGSHTNKKTN